MEQLKTVAVSSSDVVTTEEPSEEKLAEIQLRERDHQGAVGGEPCVGMLQQGPDGFALAKTTKVESLSTRVSRARQRQQAVSSGAAQDIGCLLERRRGH